MEPIVEKDFQKEFIEAMQILYMKDPFLHLKNMIKKEILEK
jgi:uncharacterized 2Fe-2S/4Fe-4S cluster protein (DUF4445 family)